MSHRTDDGNFSNDEYPGTPKGEYSPSYAVKITLRNTGTDDGDFSNGEYPGTQIGEYSSSYAVKTTPRNTRIQPTEGKSPDDYSGMQEKGALIVQKVLRDARTGIRQRTSSSQRRPPDSPELLAKRYKT